jgi:hypothetical protein
MWILRELGRLLKSAPTHGALALLAFSFSTDKTLGMISFRREVMPIISKAGCNAGACHGNANGKGGFKLSLRGESADLDWQAFTHEQFSRRINILEPDQSLILLKPSTQLAHEGGLRFATNSAEYATLRDWIGEGAVDDVATSPKLQSLTVWPSEKILLEPEGQLQLKVEAKFSDGSRRDVSSVAVYETANTGAKVSYDGLVSRQTFGETTVLVRFLQQQKAVRLAFVPSRPDFAWKETPCRNYIDEQVFAKLKTLRMNASPVSADNEFIRRAYLDLLGTLPNAEQALAFIVDTSLEKRNHLIDALLERPEFADAWGLKWADLLRVEERTLDRKGVEVFQRWIRESIANHKPVDVFVREIISARGSTYNNPPANFYRAVRKPAARGEAMAQVFLGTRLQCAQCHNHPFDHWTQDDYYNWSSCFAPVQYKVIENRRRDSNDEYEFKGEQIIYLTDTEFKNPRTGKPAQPRVLGAGALKTADHSDTLKELAEWVTSKENPFFSRAQVNRIWFHLMGRGIVDPIDDFRATNPPSHPAVLDALAADFVEHDFDLRHVIRTIMNSRTYQLSSHPTDDNGDDEINFSHSIPRRLTAEQLLDAESEVTGSPLQFAGYPVGLHAGQIGSTAADKKHERKTSQLEQVLEIFGKPPRLLTCECERSMDTTMSQAFQMISGPAINEMLRAPGNRLSQLIASGKSDAEVIDQLYWTALTRSPSPIELARASQLLHTASEKRNALEDLTWALLNAKEFILRK